MSDPNKINTPSTGDDATNNLAAQSDRREATSLFGSKLQEGAKVWRIRIGLMLLLLPGVAGCAATINQITKNQDAAPLAIPTRNAVKKASTPVSSEPPLNPYVARQEERPFIYAEHYNDIRPFSEGLAGVAVGSKKVGLNAGLRYKNLTNYAEGGAFHITPDGRPAYDARYDRVGDFYNGLALVEKDMLMFHITPDGHPAYEKRFTDAGDFHQGLARVYEDGEAFHITTDGQPVYDARYDYVGDFYEDRAKARINEQWFHIRRDNGQPAYGARYNGNRYYSQVDDFNNGLAIISGKDGEPLFHIDPDGNEKREIQAVGSPEFQERIRDALDLIQRKDLRNYRVVLRYIMMIEEAQNSHMHTDTKVFHVNSKSFPSSEDLASAIVHDACHSRLYWHDRNPQRTTEAEEATAEELICLRVQIRFHRMVGSRESRRNIRYFQSADGKHWDHNRNGRRDDYQECF